VQSNSIDISVDVSWTGDLPGRYVDRPAVQNVQVVDRPHALAGVERPAFERHDLPKERVAARVWKKPQGPPGVGFVKNASVTGMWIDTDSPMPLREQVTVELQVPGGYSATLGGRVVRANDRGMAIHLNTEDSTWQFRSSFLELARREDGQPPSVIVRRADIEPEDDTADLRDAGDLRVLGAKWHEVLADLKQDAVHQDFIQECLKRQRLEFGLERYRELKGGPDNAVAAKYLGQIGVILGFMSLKKNPQTDQSDRYARAKMLMLVVIVLGALFLARQLFMTKANVVDAPRPAVLAPRVESPEPAAIEAPIEPQIEQTAEPLPESDTKPLWELPKKKK
jgi:hypothetical protein